jgi:hypothetical protein
MTFADTYYELLYINIVIGAEGKTINVGQLKNARNLVVMYYMGNLFYANKKNCDKCSVSVF